MAISDERKKFIETFLLGICDDQTSEEDIAEEMEDWSEEDRAYFHHLTDNYEPDELRDQWEREHLT